ncbi:replication-relaxation family protein [Streptomyces sp. ODS28]|uniref:replication-relaxation family protein n=1 Tax=Streptomyces sp. ODS28 TaxID=3136688 RepID=UPI0031E8B178
MTNDFSAAQRPRRARRGRSPEQRAAVGVEFVAFLAPRLTARDRWLAHMLYEHKVFTSTQITQLAWPSPRAANHRLLQLYKWRVVDRFEPFRAFGSAPMHYVLDTAGAAVLAREYGLDAGDLGYRHRDSLGIAHSLRLAHALGTNTVFTGLVALTRQPGDEGRLTRWWSEERCFRHFGDLVRPDAYGRWCEGRHEVEWFLEYDTGTERPSTRVAAKLNDYAKLAAATAITTPVLFWTPTAHREVRLRHALDDQLASLSSPLSVPTATTCSETAGSAATARWLPLAPGGRGERLRLADLAAAWPQLQPIAPVRAEETSGTTGLPPPSPHPPPPQTWHQRG